MGTRQKIILTIYAILGLPGLLPACVLWLLLRASGMRNLTKEEFLSFMMACTLFMIVFCGIAYLLKVNQIDGRLLSPTYRNCCC